MPNLAYPAVGEVWIAKDNKEYFNHHDDAWHKVVVKSIDFVGYITFYNMLGQYSVDWTVDTFTRFYRPVDSSPDEY